MHREMTARDRYRRGGARRSSKCSRGSVTTRSNSAIDGGLRQRGQLRERPFRGIWTQRLSVVGRMRDRMRDQCTDLFPLERQKIFSGPAITCHQLRFMHGSPFERHRFSGRSVSLIE